MPSADPRDLSDRLEALARHLPIFESPGFSFGEWVPSWTDAHGVIHLGWYRLSPEADAFLRSATGSGWIAPFDWPAWAASAEGQALLSDPSAVGSATPQDLEHLLTTLVRQDRFADGTLAGANQSGLLLAILRRAAALIDG